MKDPATLFNKEHAAGYEERYARIAPLREALHLLIRIALADLRAEARIVCVGAGTGAELLALAAAFPQAHFTAVEPSGPMLDVCRERVAAAGVASRCAFHHGYIHTLPVDEPYDAATSLLVSQFILQREDRIAYFRAIAERLVPGGHLIEADLSGDLEAESSQGLKDLWQKMLIFNGSPAGQAGNYLTAWRSDVAVRPAEEIAEMIAAGGFYSPTQFYQSLFIHAWQARRKA